MKPALGVICGVLCVLGSATRPPECRGDLVNGSVLGFTVGIHPCPFS